MIKLDHWQFGSTELLLIDVEEDPLSPFVVSNVLVAALGISDQQLKNVRHRHPDRLTPIPLETLGFRYATLRDFVQAHAEELGLKRVRRDILLWPLKIALRVYKYVESHSADQFYDEGIELILQYAARNSIEMQEYKRRLEALETKYSEMNERIEAAHSSVSRSASLAGSLLATQRGTKGIRSLN